MKKVFAALIVTIAMLFFVKVVMAEGPDIKPGKWEFTTTVTMPMMPEAKVTTQTECVTLEEASDPLAAIIEEGTCKVLNKEESGNTLKFELECEGEMDMKMRGKGHFTANGTTASGKMEMTMNMQQMGGQGSQSMKMTQEWEGKRIGDCD
jgi:Protein of unknown function (DUF3617)